ncbi:hypothetical protein INS49_010510 [Diaporthe citri]|uniref:uncharacterized protein n=1 Tax=Diaporthe citri TaxID=83186 RepID=UPI001C818469|nr:uncharacterized protein INS49_010510 [Diaporthe citri]KAG6362280.1 hypothetical protein INS49_010510 [Diaporthe citri]
MSSSSLEAASMARAVGHEYNRSRVWAATPLEADYTIDANNTGWVGETLAELRSDAFASEHKLNARTKVTVELAEGTYMGGVKDGVGGHHLFLLSDPGESPETRRWHPTDQKLSWDFSKEGDFFYAPDELLPVRRKDFCQVTAVFRAQVKKSPWFKRVWTWQEGLLARSSMFVTGSDILDGWQVDNILKATRLARCSYGAKMPMGASRRFTLMKAAVATRRRTASRKLDELFGLLGMVEGGERMTVRAGHKIEGNNNGMAVLTGAPMPKGCKWTRADGNADAGFKLKSEEGQILASSNNVELTKHLEKPMLVVLLDDVLSGDCYGTFAMMEETDQMTMRRITSSRLRVESAGLSMEQGTYVVG